MSMARAVPWVAPLGREGTASSEWVLNSWWTDELSWQRPLTALELSGALVIMRWKEEIQNWGVVSWSVQNSARMGSDRCGEEYLRYVFVF